MIYHTHDADLVNRVANASGVREFVRPDGEPVDLTAAVAPLSTQTGVVALTNGEDAVALFEATAPNVYQGHTMFAPTCRGKRAIEVGRAIIAWMFAHGAEILWGSTPRDNRGARWFNRMIGFRVIGGDADEEIFEIRKAA